MFEDINNFNILAFDGGGIRGAISISILNMIQEHYPSILDKMSLIGGTSTGSFIAIGIAYGLTPKEILNIYTGDGGKQVFGKNSPGIIMSKYETDDLRNLLLTIFPKDLRLKDLSKFVVIPAFYLGENGDKWEPIFYNNLPGSDNENSRVIDVMLASSAAPLYFPIYNNHVDGGIIANDPSLVCLIHALDCGLAKSISNIKLISIGTGDLNKKISIEKSNWGAIDWIINKEVSYPIINLILESNSKFSQYCIKKILDENYIRINPSIEKNISLDDIKFIKELVKIGESYSIEKELEWIGQNWN
ncbi:MAG: patatin-like phospholipase family protein [Paeniclostridium sordellii]|nr:patatin-like phospholipase family protein [Paeniclostridium sordellii]